MVAGGRVTSHHRLPDFCYTLAFFLYSNNQVYLEPSHFFRTYCSKLKPRRCFEIIWAEGLCRNPTPVQFSKQLNVWTSLPCCEVQTSRCYSADLVYLIHLWLTFPNDGAVEAPDVARQLLHTSRFSTSHLKGVSHSTPSTPHQKPPSVSMFPCFEEGRGGHGTTAAPPREDSFSFIPTLMKEKSPLAAWLMGAMLFRLKWLFWRERRRPEEIADGWRRGFMGS